MAALGHRRNPGSPAHICRVAAFEFTVESADTLAAVLPDVAERWPQERAADLLAGARSPRDIAADIFALRTAMDTTIIHALIKAVAVGLSLCPFPRVNGGSEHAQWADL